MLDIKIVENLITYKNGDNNFRCRMYGLRDIQENLFSKTVTET